MQSQGFQCAPDPFLFQDHVHNIRCKLCHCYLLLRHPSCFLLECHNPSGMLLPGAVAFTSAASFPPRYLQGLFDCSFPGFPPGLLPLLGLKAV